MLFRRRCLRLRFDNPAAVDCLPSPLPRAACVITCTHDEKCWVCGWTEQSACLMFFGTQNIPRSVCCCVRACNRLSHTQTGERQLRSQRKTACWYRQKHTSSLCTCSRCAAPCIGRHARAPLLLYCCCCLLHTKDAATHRRDHLIRATNVHR